MRNRLALFEPIGRYVRLFVRHVSDGTLYAFYEFMRTGIERLPRQRFNILVSGRSTHYALVIWGESSADEQLRTEAKEPYGIMQQY